MKNVLTTGLALGLASCATVRPNQNGAQECIDANTNYLFATVRATDPNSAICYQQPDFLEQRGAAVKKSCSPLITDPAKREIFESTVDELIIRMRANCARLVEDQKADKSK